MMKGCWGITRKGGFCKRHGDWWIFCPGHKWTLLICIVSLPTIIHFINFSGSIASIYSVLTSHSIQVSVPSRDEEFINRIEKRIAEQLAEQNTQNKQLLVAAEKQHKKTEETLTKIAGHSTSSLPSSIISPVSLSSTGGIMPSTWRYETSSLTKMLDNTGALKMPALGEYRTPSFTGMFDSPGVLKTPGSDNTGALKIPGDYTTPLWIKTPADYTTPFLTGLRDSTGALKMPSTWG